MFYLLAGNGLFVCRNHPFFRSCVPLEGWPRELADQEPFLESRYPRLPQVLFERVIGFFSMVARLHGAEAAVLLLWDARARRVRLLIPDQRSTVSRGPAGLNWPIDVRYQTPNLPSHLMVIGDIHSHVDGPAYASFADRQDEVHRPGLHIVAGRIREEPPELHIEVTVDGQRFRVKNQSAFLEGYARRREDEVPRAWLDKLTLEVWSSSRGHGDLRGNWNGGSTPSTVRRCEDSRLLIDPDPGLEENQGHGRTMTAASDPGLALVARPAPGAASNETEGRS